MTKHTPEAGDYVRVKPEALEGRYHCETYYGRVLHIAGDVVRLHTESGRRDARLAWCEVRKRGTWIARLEAVTQAATILPRRS